MSALPRFNVPGVTFEPGQGGLPRVAVSTPAAEAHIYLHGAHVTHYQPRAGRPVLFMSGSSHFAITHSLDPSGTLVVQGDSANDVITVQDRGSYLEVSQNAPDLNWAPPTVFTLEPLVTNYSTRYFRVPPNYYLKSSVQRVLIGGGDGHDEITVNASGNSGSAVAAASLARSFMPNGTKRVSATTPKLFPRSASD